MKVLGLDVGNGKLKCCLIDWHGSWEQSPIRWDSLPLPLTARRRQDFGAGLPIQIFNFLDAQGLEPAELAGVVACCSHSFSYQPYSESVSHLAEILALFGEVPTALVRADGALTPIEAISALPIPELYAYTFTNFYGSALLGSRLIRNGLSLDLGTTTLDIIPVVEGQIDPPGLADLADPADYLRFRYSHGRIHWLGLNTTPLCMLATRVPLGDRLYQVVPRHYRSDLLFGLEPEGGDLLQRHAYGQGFPDSQTCHQQLAQFIGLDDSLLSASEIREVRNYLFQQLVERVAAELSAVANQVFPTPAGLEIASFALGEDLVLKPALALAGFDPQRIRTLALGRDQALWSASSVFAMALLALETKLGKQLTVNR
ncbi:MAG TPA: hypothetical protein V6D23_00345 [Candidatus Obscuribacterales bacterium]